MTETTKQLRSIFAGVTCLGLSLGVAGGGVVAFSTKDALVREARRVVKGLKK